MSSISTHVLDVSVGRPAAGVRVALERESVGGWEKVGMERTNADGRVARFLPRDVEAAPGVYRLVFDTGAYQEGFYPEVCIAFRVTDAGRHYHVPLLLSPYGYSTYRGS